MIEEMEWRRRMPILTLSGPSLSGKTELSKMLAEKCGMRAVVSMTTRPKRAREVEGRDYFFVSDEEYAATPMVQKTDFNGFKYGVSEKEVEGSSIEPLVWVVAPQSLEQISEYCAKTGNKLVKAFVTNPEEVLLHRLFERFRSDAEAKTETYVKRLSSMTGSERYWVADAISGKVGYDLVFERFDENVQEEVMGRILGTLRAKNSKRP